MCCCCCQMATTQNSTYFYFNLILSISSISSSSFSFILFVFFLHICCCTTPSIKKINPPGPAFLSIPAYFTHSIAYSSSAAAVAVYVCMRLTHYNIVFNNCKSKDQNNTVSVFVVHCTILRTYRHRHDDTLACVCVCARAIYTLSHVAC